MNCDRIQALAAGSLYEPLDEGLQCQIDEHLCHCRNCADEFEQMRTARNRMLEHWRETVPSLSIAAIGAVAMQRVERSRRRWRMAAMFSLATTILCAIGLFAANRTRPPANRPGPASTILADHARRLDDTDLLIEFLVRGQGINRTQLEKELLVLRAEMEKLKQRQTTIVRTMNHYRRQPSAGDLASIGVVPDHLARDLK